MDTAYAWRPGNRAVSARWPVPTNLFADEILSSWVTRAALNQGCDVLTLATLTWPDQRIFSSDLDRGLAPGICADPAANAGIALDVLNTATLRPIAKCLLGKTPPKKAVWPYSC